MPSKNYFKSCTIRAGAGTGKTTSLVQEVYRAFKDPQFRLKYKQAPKLMVCTFTRKASQELKEKLFKKAIEELQQKNIPTQNQQDVHAFLKDKASFLHYITSSSLHVSTIDGILNLFLKRYGFRFGLTPDFNLNHNNNSQEIFDSLAKSFIFEENLNLLQKLPYSYLKTLLLAYVKSCLKYENPTFYDNKDFAQFAKRKETFDATSTWCLKTVQDKFPEFYSLFKQDPIQAKNKIKQIFCEDGFESEHIINLFQEFKKTGDKFMSKFMEKKKSHKFLDIEYLSLFSLALLREHEQTAKDFSKEWDYWLIDEYQDTSWIQEQIIDKITQFNHVFCVGDPGQSIYLFRDADPKVFKRREQDPRSQLKTLDINYRSSKELIHFFNDFFPKESGFIMFKSPQKLKTNKQASKDPEISFFTYDKQKESKIPTQALQASMIYIKKLIAQNESYKDICILSSKNQHLEIIASYLRSNNLPVLLYSSQNFSKKRQILDILFLLKFFINPLDNDNLKALLRTEYFKLEDQKLADYSQDYHDAVKTSQATNRLCFWQFLKNKLANHVIIQNLNLYLDQIKSRGLSKTLETAVVDSGILELSYLQDPTGSLESNFWKFLYILNTTTDSPLDLFYSLFEDKKASMDHKQDVFGKSSEAIQIMTIHKSKGLEFKHVMLMDFSLDRSILKGGRGSDNNTKDFIYDEQYKKISFPVPIQARDDEKIKSYGHKMHDFKQSLSLVQEINRLYYVAMTRAKQSLVVFIPNYDTEKNSWLKSVSFFKKHHVVFCKKNEDPTHAQTDISQHKDKQIYQCDKYSFAVQHVKDIVRISKAALKDAQNLAKTHIKALEVKQQTKPVHVFKILKHSNNQEDQIQQVSSQTFIKKLDEISLLKTKNVNKVIKNKAAYNQDINLLFKTNLGLQLHYFLQKLTVQPLSLVQDLVNNSFLSQKDKQKIQEALIYVQTLQQEPVALCFKTAFSEFSFKLKKYNKLLVGQIDLWFYKSKDIHICDYKSSVSDQTKKQLIFYSGVLDSMYSAKQIWMHELYPFQKQIITSQYNKQNKQLFKQVLQNKQN